MEKIETKKYKGYETEFFILPKIKEYIDSKDVKLAEYILDDFHWYEHILFDLLDPELDEKWNEEKETRKNFKVIFYGIIEKWIDKNPEGFDEDFEYNDESVLSDTHWSIHPDKEKPFAVKYKIIIKNKN